jgi:hypothetical protein
MLAPRLALAVIAACVAAQRPAAADGPSDPFALYGSDMAFAVWREGTEIGEHRVTFARQDGALVARSLFDIAVKLIGITVYTYRYTSEEIWRDGKLQSLASTIDDNGTKTAVNAKEEDGKLAVTGPAAHEVISGFILPSTHWNAQVIGATRVLNTLSGKIDAVKLVPSGVESVPVGSTTRQATHYRYTGAISAESWYDADGHWLKLRFPGTDGTPIDYVCERCVAAPAPP